MPFGPNDILWLGILPAALAALVTAIAARLALRPTATWTLGIATGLFVGLVAQNFRVSPATAWDKLLHPRVALDWLPWLVFFAAAIQLLAAYTPRARQRWLLAIAGIFTIAIPVRLLARSVYVTTRWTTTEKLAVVGLWSLFFAALWTTLAVGRRNHQPLLRSGLLLLVTFGLAVTLAASGALTLGECAGIAVATLGGTAVVAWLTSAWLTGVGLSGNRADGPSHAAGPLAVALGSLLLVGYFYANLTAVNAVLLALSIAAAAGFLPLPLPLGEGRGEVEGRGEGKRWDEGEGREEGDLQRSWAPIALRTAAALIPLAIAAWSAISTAMANSSGY